MPRKTKAHRDEDNPYFDYIKSDGGRDAMVLNKTGIELVEKLASIQCTTHEIAAILNCNHDTLYTERNSKLFTEAYSKGKLVGKVNVRQKLAERMAKGSDSCIIFSCKAILGMSDRVTPAYENSSLEGLVKAIEEMKSEDDEE